MAVNAIAAAWGFAEATLFFIVPDVWLSWLGRKKLRRGLVACICALAGALLGGLFTYSLGSADPEGLAEMMQRIPAIDSAMIVRVRESLVDDGVIALFWGPLTGTPYKLFAAQASAAGVGLFTFLLISIPARFLRFVVVTAAVHVAYVGLQRCCPQVSADRILAATWLLFYLGYFMWMPG